MKFRMFLIMASGGTLLAGITGAAWAHPDRNVRRLPLQIAQNRQRDLHNYLRDLREDERDRVRRERRAVDRDIDEEYARWLARHPHASERARRRERESLERERRAAKRAIEEDHEAFERRTDRMHERFHR
jgi:hypothetical protein